MGSEPQYEPSSTPKLSLYSLPSKQPGPPPGLQTPPLHTLASVPFRWEEAPGKPRPTTPSKSKASRCLDLPPRLLMSESAKITNIPSPTTVLDGPDVGSSLSQTLSFSSHKWSFRSHDEGVRYRKGDGNGKERFNVSSWRWGRLKENGGAMEGSFDFSYPDSCGFESDTNTRVKITRVRRVRSRSSFLSLSDSSSKLLASIYDSFKQVVPWRRRQGKWRKTGL